MLYRYVVHNLQSLMMIDIYLSLLAVRMHKKVHDV